MPEPAIVAEGEDVEVPSEMTDEELTEAIQKGVAGEEAGGEPVEDKPAKDPAGTPETPDDDTEVKPDGGDDTTPRPAEGKPDEEAPATEDPSKAVAKGEEDTVESLRAALAKEKEDRGRLETQLNDKERFIAQRGTEIGTLRKDLDDMKAAHDAAIKDPKFYVDDPESVSQAIDRSTAIKDKERQIEEAEVTERFTEVKAIVHGVVPNFEEMIGPMVEELKTDGIPEAVIEDFKRNPYNQDPGLLVNLANRTKAVARIKALESEVETLKGKPDEVLENIEKAAKGRTQLDGATGGSPERVQRAVDPSKIADLGDEELEKLLKEANGGTR